MSASANITNMLNLLAQQQDKIVFLGNRFGDKLQQQFHHNLSPPGWHCGHCCYTENLWLERAGAEIQPVTEPCDTRLLFSATGMEREQRVSRLPPAAELLLWLNNCIQINRRRLTQLFQQPQPHNELLQRHFLLHFLTEHAAQHTETMIMIATQQSQPYYQAQQELVPCNSLPEFATIVNSGYVTGLEDDSFGYDNEKGCHTQELATTRIARTTVNNAMWLAFMQAGGYRNDALWSAAGKSWRDRDGWQMPGFWKRDNKGRLYSISATGALELEPEAPVTGISLYEAEAFACWAGSRLPHEYEWEAACKSGLIHDNGIVWEWCGNTFHPYPSFRAFPYQGYSVPYFDQNHYVLRGGSIHTATRIKRPSFRNFYIPETRYLYSGLRLARDV